MPTFNIILFGVALPALLGALAFALGGKRSWAGALGVGAAFAVADWGVLGKAPWPAVEATQGLFFVALAGALAGAVESAARPRLLVALPIRLVLALGALYALLRQPYVTDTWTRGEAAAHLSALAAATALFWTALERLDARPEPRARLPGLRAPIFLASLAGAGALVLGLTGSAVLAQLAGALAAALGPAAALALIGRPPALSPGAVAPLALTLSGLLASGHYYSDTPAPAALLLAAAPLLALVNVALGFVPIGLAVGIAARAHLAAAASAGGPGY